MKIIGIIPARYGSTRFPGKPLADINGQAMIQRVYGQALKARLIKQVFVATDDERICDHVRSFGGNVIMTHTNHKNGTERCAEAAMLIGEEYEGVINIQGDEPFIDPRQIDLVAMSMKEHPDAIATLVKKLEDFNDYLRPDVVKAVFDHKLKALYFSRAPIPHIRSDDAASVFYAGEFYKHIGIYGFPTAILKEIVQLPEAILEQTEMLEQLRWLQHGYTIRVKITELESQAIDTPEDMKLATRKLKG